MPRSGSTSDATRREGIRETEREFERNPDREVVVARADTMDDEVIVDTPTKIPPSRDDYSKR